jgi:uncharacterized protein
LTNEERKIIKKDDFEEWYGKGNVSYKHFNYAFQDNDLNMSAFMLHQATE